MSRHTISPFFRQYLVATLVFWLAALVLFGGGTKTVHVMPFWVLVNFALLVPLKRESEVARILLVLFAGSAAITLGWVTFTEPVEPFNILLIVAMYQVVCLWRLGRTPRWLSDRHSGLLWK